MSNVQVVGHGGGAALADLFAFFTGVGIFTPDRMLAVTFGGPRIAGVNYNEDLSTWVRVAFRQFTSLFSQLKLN